MRIRRFIPHPCIKRQNLFIGPSPSLSLPPPRVDTILTRVSGIDCRKMRAAGFYYIVLNLAGTI